MSPSSTMWDVEAKDGSAPIRIGNVKLEYSFFQQCANIYTPEMSNPKFVIRANRCKPHNFMPMSCGGLDKYEFEIYDT